MKKKIIIINGFLLFITTVFLFIFNNVLINSNNVDYSSNLITEYSTLVENYFDGTNIDETIEYFSTLDDLRITIFDSEHNVVKDSNISFDEGDDRPELSDLGVIYTRESNNLNIKMFYLAVESNGYIIRVSMEINVFNSMLLRYSQIGAVILFIILLISVLLSIYLLNKTINPINSVVSKIGEISGNDNLTINNQTELHNEINDIQTQMQKRIIDLEKEKLKIEGILEASTDGIIVIDEFENIVLINNNALEIFSLNIDVLNKSYHNLVNSTEVIKNISNYFKNKKLTKNQTFINNNVYSIKSLLIDNEFIKGLLIILDDITLEYNLSKVKKDFFQNASHELKSPLTSIIGYQQLIQQGIYSTKEEILDGVNDTIKQANRMNSMVIEMLELSQLESEYQTEKEDINVKQVVLQVIDELKLFINKRNINIILNLNDCIKEVNKKHIEQLVKNIIENGIKYNNENGNLIITLNENEFIVKDNGIGIDKKHIDRIFERFYRISSNNQIRGNGLGLAIVKHITNTYGYDVSVDSVLTQYTEIKVTF